MVYSRTSHKISLPKVYQRKCCHGNTGIRTEKIEGASQLDIDGPETQMQRSKRLGNKLDSDKVFDTDRMESSDETLKVQIGRRNRSLKVYIPQAERESVSSSRSSRNVTV